jgi:hypothetical protein
MALTMGGDRALAPINRAFKGVIGGRGIFWRDTVPGTLRPRTLRVNFPDIANDFANANDRKLPENTFKY